jgi:hypothetical protein
MNSVNKFIPTIIAKLKVLGGAFVAWIVKAYPPALRAVLDMMYKLGQWLQKTGLPALAKTFRQWRQRFLGLD